MKVLVAIFVVALGGVASAQTSSTVRDSCGRAVERATVVRDPYGRIIRTELPRGTTTVVLDRTGRTVALMNQPVRPQGAVVVRDPIGRVVQQIQPSPCGRGERVVERLGRVVETRQVIPNGNVVVRDR